MIRPLSIFLLLASSAFGADLSSELRATLADAKRHPLPRQARYVTAWHLPPELKPAEALSLVVNSVSRSARIIKPVQVTRTIWRIDMDAYGLSPKLWESLVGDEPYLHLRTKVIDPTTGKATEVITDAGHIDLKAAAELRELSGSAGALMRLDWFVAKVSVPPHYYSWDSTPDNLRDYRKSFGADTDKILELQANKGENVLHSGVTSKARRISRWPTPLGAVWTTYDTAGVDPKNDPVRNAGFDQGVDAHEVIASKRNGLFSYAIFDGAGKRVDVVPDFIARDFSNVNGDQRLVPMRSCVVCHSSGGDAGLKKFSTDQTELFKAGAQLLTSNPQTAAELEAFYDAPRLARQFVRDIEDYGDATKLATGLDAKGSAESLHAIFDLYENTPVSAATAARELGVAEIPAFARSTDGILVALLLGKSVTRKQWEASFQEAALLSQLLKP